MLSCNLGNLGDRGGRGTAAVAVAVVVVVVVVVVDFAVICDSLAVNHVRCNTI